MAELFDAKPRERVVEDLGADIEPGPGNRNRFSGAGKEAIDQRLQRLDDEQFVEFEEVRCAADGQEIYCEAKDSTVMTDGQQRISVEDMVLDVSGVNNVRTKTTGVRVEDGEMVV